MDHLKRGSLFLLAAMSFAVVQARPEGPDLLRSLRRSNRILLVFAPSEVDARYVAQLSEVSGHVREAVDRDLLLIPLAGGHSPRNPAVLAARTQHVSEEQEARLRTQFHVSSRDFAVILLGKDGGEKLRRGAPVSMRELSALIDAMPMRQDELRARGSGH